MADAPTLVTDSAVEDYVARVRGGARRGDRARADLAQAFASPLFRVGGPKGSTLIGLIDVAQRRFLALLAEDGNVVEIGPPHHWGEARAAWKAAGWDVACNRPVRSAAEAGLPSPPGQGRRKGAPKPGNFVDLGSDVPVAAEAELVALGARRQPHWEARIRDLSEARRIVEAHGGSLSDVARRKMDRRGDA